jgi:hypothetical protein
MNETAAKASARRIFLSYGHDEHAPLARRLKQDLEAPGARGLVRRGTSSAG